jgi:hypothetical protein
MSKSAAVELEQLQTAVRYLVGLLEEGSLVKNYDDTTREDLADVLCMLLDKVHGLPENVPENLVQAAVVRSIGRGGAITQGGRGRPPHPLHARSGGGSQHSRSYFI